MWKSGNSTGAILLGDHEHRGKVIIIDGNSLLHRAFYALPPLTTSSGEHTNAVFGFTNMLFRLLDEERPDLLAVAFDRPAPTFRHVAYEDYKANRKKMPDELASQVPLAKQVVEALGVPIFEIDGYEADDVIGTISKLAEEQGYDVMIVTGDRDAFQLISPHVKVMITRKGIKDIEVFDEDQVKEKYGIAPSQVVDIKSLAGDASDNIPGVHGIGEKTAHELIATFGSLENLLSNLDKVSKKRVRELLEQGSDSAILSKQLATIDREVPIKVDLSACKIGTPDSTRLAELFRRLEFKSLLRRIGPTPLQEQAKGSEHTTAAAAGSARTQAEDIWSPTEAAQGPAEVVQGPAEGARSSASAEDFLELPYEAECVVTGEQLKKVICEILSAGICAFEAIRGRGKPVEAPFIGIGFALPDGHTYYVPLGHYYEGAPGLPEGEALTLLKPVLENPECKKIVHDGKPGITMLLRRGVKVRGLQMDAMVAAYLLNPEAGEMNLQDLCRKYLGFELRPPDAPSGSSQSRLIDLDLGMCGADEMAKSVGHRLAALMKLSHELENLIHHDGMDTLLREVEVPLVSVLAEMEASGVSIDENALKDVSSELGLRISQIAQDIYDLAGEEFNINSTKQLGAILFDKLKLPPVRKTKTGYSTDAEVLEALAEYHVIAARILEYRELVKLKSTYADALSHLVNPVTKRIHTTFHQTITATGRLSSSDPNLQNIPVRSEEGRRIRRVFVPGREGWKILSADYSQIELRILAHFSQDEELIRAFNNDEDIHTATAASVFGVDPDSVTSAMRSRAKAVNFGIVYGITDYGLARGIGLSRKDARDFIDRYFAHYKGVKEYLDRAIVDARSLGYVTTLMGRRRYLPDLNSSRAPVRRFAERTAMNTPIQGTAADIIKLAMVRIAKELSKGRFKTMMILQVHDELVFESPDEEVLEIARMVKRIMENVVPLAVPLKVDVKAGPNWLDTGPVNL